MASIMKISPQGQIRIPKSVLESLKITEGDYLEVDVERGQITLKPRKLIDPLQGWFWTREWQTEEESADKDIQNGNLSPQFHKKKDGLEWLKK